MLHYEIHVTVRTNEVERFQDVCKDIGVKSIILDLQKKSGDVLCEVMTSSTISTHDKTVVEAKAAMVGICVLLTKAGFDVIRSKIETVPWHPLAPSEHNGQSHFEGSHFETHFGVVINYSEDVDNLKKIAEQFNLHWSKNILKRRPDGSYIQMVTYRSYDKVSEDFSLLVDQILKTMYSKHLTLEKLPKIEFAVYDTNHKHDLNWIE
jgi:hypothetical protein